LHIFPPIVFTSDGTAIVNERYLDKFMIPKNEGIFVDVGAYVGSWTLFLGKKGIEVHAFEPDSIAYSVLWRKSRKLPNIHTHSCALGERNGSARLNGYRIVAKPYEDNTRVPMKKLDSFSFENVGLIKIDTEGYEIPVLLGARQTILQNKPRLIIEIHKPYKEQKRKIMEILKELGYQWIICYKSAISQPHIIADPEPFSS